MAASKRRHVVVDSDDEDDNVPLAALAAAHKVVAPGGARQAAAARPSSSSSSSSSAPKRAKKRSSSSGSSSSSKRASTARTATIESKRAAKASSRSSTPSKSRSSGGSKSAKYAKLVVGKAGNRELDPEWPIKHQAAEAVLCRWQYSGLPYPPSDLDTSVPEGCMALPGFPGVSVGIEHENMGKIHDRRPAEPRPSLAFLLSLSSKTLATMYEAAVAGQLHALAEAEGPEARKGPVGRALQAELNRSVKVIGQLAGPKLDRQAAKHEAAQGRPDLAKRILDNAGEAALTAAGGLRAVPGTSLAREVKPSVKAEAKAKAKPAPAAAADVKPLV